MVVAGCSAVLYSNWAGSANDAGHKAAATLERSVGIHVLRHNSKKPAGIEKVTEYFECAPSELAMVGDRLFTDVVFGNLNGMVTIATQPFTTAGENRAVKLVCCTHRRSIPYPPQEPHMCHRSTGHCCYHVVCRRSVRLKQNCWIGGPGTELWHHPTALRVQCLDPYGSDRVRGQRFSPIATTATFCPV